MGNKPVRSEWQEWQEARDAAVFSWYWILRAVRLKHLPASLAEEISFARDNWDARA